MNYLLLTLGHGSSAVFVDNSGDKQKIIGYEQERLSGIKADSQFPIDAINEIEYNIGFDAMKGCNICISHWFNDYSQKKDCSKDVLHSIKCKYITDKDIEKLNSYQPSNIFLADSSFTHHDAHAYSAYAFYDYIKKADEYKSLYCIVADGFGTNEEVLSIYSRRGNKNPELIHRIYGYDASLGLFYQYATSFCGMKENQDEYKFLGYEAHIDEELDINEIAYLNKEVINCALYFIKKLANTEIDLQKTNNIINFDNTNACKKYWYAYFDKILNNLDVTNNKTYKARCIIAYFIQQTVEQVLEEIIKKFKIDDICVVGGCFYNVKLNNKILTTIAGDFCAMPLAGDQGAAIGIYSFVAEKPFNFGTLCWGKRRMYNAEKLLSNLKGDVIIVNETTALSDKFINEVATHIANGKIINLVRGNMEFGPRALCNTSTLMLPSIENVATNNKMNNRNEVMPCAPVCTYRNAAELFDVEEIEKVIGSDKYMICTHNYKKPYSNAYGGVMHHKTLTDDTYTGRPQIVSQDDRFMVKLLYKVDEICDAKCLVNTSFNAHGNPIVFDTIDIIHNYKYQCEHIEYEKRPILIVIL